MTRRDPSGDGEYRAPARPEWGRRRGRRALVAALPLVAIVAGLWIERRPIAIHYIDRTLAANHVAARYRLTTLGPGRQQLTDVVIGDPAHPDLVADWIETRTGIGLHGIELTGVRAGQVRLRGRIVDGRLSLGEIDRLLPRSGGGGGGLPGWWVEITDARMRVDTPAGPVGVALTGRGRLDGGFEGRAAIAAGPLSASGCNLAPSRAALRVWTKAGRIGLAGPTSADRLACGTMRWQAPRVVVDASVDPVTSQWRGRWQVAGGTLIDPRARAGAVAGGGTVEGGDAAVTGRLILAANAVSAGGATAARLATAGSYRLGSDSRFDGEVTVARARVPIDARRGAAALAGTPLGPMSGRAGEAINAALRSVDGSARVSVARHGNATAIKVSDGILAAASGARGQFAGDRSTVGAINGRFSLDGGGLPALRATMRRASAWAPVTGVATMRPYRVGVAMAALTPVSFTLSRSGEAQMATVATLSGPLGGGGRVDRLSLPLVVHRTAGGAVLVGEDCAPVSFASLATGGLRLDPARLVLCPVNGALARIAADGSIGGGVRTGAVRLSGRLGSGPVAVDAGSVSVALATRGFTVSGVTATLGAADRPTRFATTSLTGAIARGGGASGGFTGASGRIGAVPLALSKAAGTWRFAGGALDVAGALTVADADVPDPACVRGAADPPRFCPMFARGVALRLVDGRIAATATLAEPATGTTVAGIAIDHDLSSGAGHADLMIDKLAFAKGFQPDLLTPVTQGVIADVAGTVVGEGRIDWGGTGVTSTGRFATAGLDLAAAFGPVTGIAGSIAFTDLLGLVSAPGQQVTVASINPGVAVENGTITFHTEPGVKVAVERARWPFAGGTLSLDPTLLDFSAPAQRHMTFRLDGIAADRFLQQFDFKNLAATGTFDGVLPMVFDAKGGRIEQGRLTVREGGGGLAYVGDLTQKELGFWGNLAFQALKSLRYRSLSILMGGPLDGDIVTEVRFAGVSQGQGAKSNFLIRRLQRLPFVFNVRIEAPFRTLLDGLDPARQAQLHLRDLIDDARRPAPPVQTPIQPGASETMP